MVHHIRLLARVFVFVGAGIACAASAKNRDSTIETSAHVRIHVVDAGADGGKPALVLVPGWSFGASVWTAQIERFSRDRRVVAIDPRSQGESTKMTEGNTPEQRARDLREVLDRLQLNSVVLVGWSQGVQDVAAFVDQFGSGRLRGIVLVDSTVSAGAKSIEQAPPMAAAQFERLAIYAENPRAYLRGMMQAIITRPIGDAEMNRRVDDAMKTPATIGTAMLVADLFGVDRTPALAKFDRPTLVIAAATSPELDAQKSMAAKLPRGRFEVVANAGHALFIDQPEKFDALLSEFLAGLK